MRTFFVLFAAAFFTASCTAPAPPAAEPYKPVASVKQVMLSITIPASDIVFGVGSEEPKTDADWLKVQNAALALAESGNLLLMPGRAVDKENWTKEALGMVDASSQALKAAEARSVDEVLAAGDKVYASCESCHKGYMAK
jgi:cytochrome c556